MARTIPLIRAAALFPMLRWLKERQQDDQEWLAAVGLERVTEAERERPIPLLKGFDLFRNHAARHGPDACAQVISDHSLHDLGVLGEQIRGARTPREALTRVAYCLPHYSTHEIVQARPIAGGLRIQAGWSMVLDEEMMHLTQQFTAGLVTLLCRATTQPAARPRAISLRPHPIFGVDHLQQVYGVAVRASGEVVLSVDIDDDVLDAPFRVENLSHATGPGKDWVLPQGDGSFSASVCLALAALDTSQPISVDSMASLAGLNRRSFQRLLTAEGTSFRQLFDKSRRTKALVALKSGSRQAGVAAGSLGFSNRSSLSRAVRRWTGSSPRNLRSPDLP
jgi:AraC-like DNA-binding protein